MRITQSFGSYNQRRYGRPWIAKIISWPVGGKAEVAWGSYLGSDSGGEVEIDANPGDVVRTGQKDGRSNGTSADWYIVSLDGSLIPTTAAKAKDHWESTKITKPNPLATFTTEELMAEISQRNSV